MPRLDLATRDLRSMVLGAESVEYALVRRRGRRGVGLRVNSDGLTVSADGSLWVAQWGGSCVRRHAPTGELLDVVTVDATQASCPAFVGPDLDLLAITSAQEGLASWSDHSGAIFLADVGATGLPVPRWPGSTTTPYWLG